MKLKHTLILATAVLLGLGGFATSQVVTRSLTISLRASGPSAPPAGSIAVWASSVDGKVYKTNSSAATSELVTTAAHASTHITGGGDTIASAVASGAAGLLTGTDKAKLDGIEALADVTDFANVSAALASSSSSVAFNSQRLTGVADPTSDQDAATRKYANGERTVTSTATIVAGALLKVSGDGTFDHLGIADSAQLCVGVAVTGRTGAGTFTARIAQPITMVSDGTGTIANGAPVIPSTTTAGRIKQGTVDDPGLMGINSGAAVAASSDATASVIP